MSRYGGILFDLDGTLTPVRSSWQFVHERLGLWTGRAEDHQRRFRAGEISYEEFCRLDAAEWRGIPVSRLERTAAEIGYRPGIRRLMGAIGRAGLKTGIVSTGLSVLAERVRRELRIDFARSNHLVSAGGWLTGGVDVRVTHGRKDVAVGEFCRTFSLDPESVIAVGDTEGDISMFEAAGRSIAFNVPEECLAAVAPRVDRMCAGPSLEDLLAALPL